MSLSIISVQPLPQQVEWNPWFGFESPGDSIFSHQPQFPWRFHSCISHANSWSLCLLTTQMLTNDSSLSLYFFWSFPSPPILWMGWGKSLLLLFLESIGWGDYGSSDHLVTRISSRELLSGTIPDYWFLSYRYGASHTVFLAKYLLSDSNFVYCEMFHLDRNVCYSLIQLNVSFLRNVNVRNWCKMCNSHWLWKLKFGLVVFCLLQH